MGIERTLSPLAGQVREILAGRADGNSQIARAVAEPPGAPGWFTPDDAIWTVHGSVATFLGGIRSLLLQTLHPLALAGVDRHSSYREDPFGRLQRTGAFIAATTYGSVDLAEKTIAAITSLHSTVRGTVDDGRVYSAQDPRLLEWVHVGLVDSMLSAYLAFGHDGAIDPDGYVADMAVVGRAMGVVNPPRSQAHLSEVLAGFRPELTGGPDVDRTVEFILNAPLPISLRPGYRILAGAALTTLPPWATQLLGHDVSRPMRPVVRGAADASLRTLKFALVASPARLAGERRLQSSLASTT